MLKINIYFATVLMLTGCSNKTGGEQNQNTDGITLSGSVSYPQQGNILLEKYEANRTVPFDTLFLDENYSFKKTVNIVEPGYYRLNFYNIQFVNMLLHQDDVKVRVDGNDRSGFAEISGSSDHDFISAVQNAHAAFRASPQMQQINQRYSMAMNSGRETDADKAMEEYTAAGKAFTDSIASVIDSVGATLGVIEVLKSGRILDKDEYHDLYVRIANDTRKKLPQSAAAMEFADEIELRKKLAIGQIAPEIALPNPDGKVIPLSSLRGNYVLVDFWAKWCGPCRRENPNVVKVYNKYHDKGFEVYGVSLDRRKEDWLMAIEQDGLHWTQVSDLKYWQSEVAKTYNIKGIPFALLLDPEGRIIGKNLRGRALDKKLAEIFGEG